MAARLTAGIPMVSDIGDALLYLVLFVPSVTLLVS
jgi:hypothetical protein